MIQIKTYTKSSIFITAIFLLQFSFVKAQDEVREEYFEMSKNLSIFTEAYKNINLYFVDETSPGDLMKTGIDAMLNSLDPYTVYIPESRIEDFKTQQTGKYGGIGSMIQTNTEGVTVTNPYEGFPAQKAGLKAGDKIIEIDGNLLKGKTAEEVSKMLKGTPGSKLIVKIKRQNQTEILNYEIERALVKIPSVPHFEMIEKGTAYIKLTQFTASATSDIEAAYNKLKEKNEIKKLVLDLRGNPGGLLDESVKIVNFFVPKGTMIVETKGRIKSKSYVLKAPNKPIMKDIPVVVLVNRSSASASEIVSGALQDLDRAVVVGEESYGKGLVQQTKAMEYNTMMKFTIAKYYTPSGRCIQRLDYSDRKGKGNNISDSLVHTFTTKNGRKVMDGRGVHPDIEVKEKTISALSIGLIQNNIIFDYATDFYYNTDSIVKPEIFQINDVEYEKFKKFVLNKKFDYSTYSEKILEQLKESSVEEKYYESFKKEFEEIAKKLAPNKERDLEKFKPEIKELLSSEIVSRYFYQKGQVTYNLRHDSYIDEALKILNNQEEYNKVLNITSK